MSEETPEKGGDRRRVRDGGEPDATGRSSGAKVRLTERQRREARELRRKRARSTDRRKGRSAAPVKGAIVGGVRTTAREIGRALAFLGRGLGTAVGNLWSLILIGIGALLSGASAILGRIGSLLATAGAAAGRAALALDRILTPSRAVLMVSALAGALLLVSQFLDYRAIEIGASGYDPILDLTRAPRTGAETPIGAHSIVLVVGAIVALGCCAGLVLTGRRTLAIPIAAVGLLTLAVGLAFDLPRGLDSAAASAAYADASAILLSGFWLEIGSGAVLLAGGAILALGPAGARSRAASSRRRGADRRRERGGSAARGAA